MIVEVLERGTPPGSRTRVTRCQTCRSKLRFKEADARLVPDQRDGDYLTFKCPVCHHDVTVAIDLLKWMET